MASNKFIVDAKSAKAFRENIKEKADRFGEIKQDDAGWYQQNIVRPFTTWLNTRPGGPVVTTLKAASSFVPGVGEMLDVAEGNPGWAIFGAIPIVGDIPQAVRRGVDEMPLDISHNIVKKEKPSVEAFRKRANTAAKRQKQQYDFMKEKHGTLEDDALGNRSLHFKNKGDKNSIYGVAKDSELSEMELDAQYRAYGQFESPYKDNPYFEDLGDGSYRSSTGRFIMSDHFKNGGHINELHNFKDDTPIYINWIKSLK